MANTVSTFNIDQIAVRQIDGLFSLNDLHKAAGGEEKHQPAKFVRLDTTQALVRELSSPDVESLKTVVGKGKAQGTYACRELVIAYAAWISAAFHLKVIRVFLATQTPQAAQSLPTQAPYSVAPGQILNDDQATTLRTMLAEFAPKLPKAKQGAFMMQGWAKLKTHFGTDYRHIPASQYFDALSIIARHIAAWDDGASATPLPTGQAPQGEKLTASDMANLRNMIYLCTTGFHYQGAWTQAIWAYLRKALGVPSAQGYTVDHLPRLAQELQYVASATSQMHELMTEMEREAARRIFRKSEVADMVLAQIESEARACVQAKTTGMASLPSYLQRDLLAITQRLSNRFNRGDGEDVMGFAS